MTREQIEQWFEQHGVQRYEHCEVRDLALASLRSPVSEERIREIAKNAHAIFYGPASGHTHEGGQSSLHLYIADAIRQALRESAAPQGEVVSEPLAAAQRTIQSLLEQNHSLQERLLNSAYAREELEKSVERLLPRDSAQSAPAVEWPEEPSHAVLLAGNEAIASQYPAKRTVSAIYKAMRAAHIAESAKERK